MALRHAPARPPRERVDSFEGDIGRRDIREPRRHREFNFYAHASSLPPIPSQLTQVFMRRSDLGRRRCCLNIEVLRKSFSLRPLSRERENERENEQRCFLSSVAQQALSRSDPLKRSFVRLSLVSRSL